MRLIENGFDLASSNTSITTAAQPDVGSSAASSSKKTSKTQRNSYLIGRAWRITHQRKSVGFLLDAPGQFCAMNWQPIVDELASTEFSLTLYDNYSALAVPKTFSQFTTIFKKAKNLEEARNMINLASFELEPCLYWKHNFAMLAFGLWRIKERFFLLDCPSAKCPVTWTFCSMAWNSSITVGLYCWFAQRVNSTCLSVC